MPALPLDEAGKYVAGAYVVFLAVIVIYVAIMATKLRGLEARWRRLEQAGDGAESGPGESAGRARAERAEPAAPETAQTGNAREP